MLSFKLGEKYFRMKKILTLLALIISFSMNAQMTDNSTDTSATGSYSVAMGNATTASGDFSTAMGRSTTASGGYSTSMGGYTIASGGYSTAMGYGSIASGSYSTAMGYDTRASGSDSTAMGFLTEASGDFSTAMGYYTIASGSTSTAMGYQTEASDRSSLVIGEYNLLGSTVTNSTTVFSTDNTAFVIGNGTFDNRSDALTVLFDGTTNVAGSVTATSFIGDGSQLTNISSGPFSLNQNSVTGIQSGINTASGGDSIAMGFYSEASGQTSTAIGLATIASGDSSTAMGGFTTASGYASTAMGADTVASGMMSTAMGFLTTASDYSSLVIGRFNSLGSTVTNSADQFSVENTAFVIGNGVAADNRSDAFTVMFNGDATLAGNLSVNSDAKLKSNIVSLGSTLAKVLMLDGKSYRMKNDPESSLKIGLVAQNIEQTFPELVSESNGIKSVNYQGLIPVLINAMKEQQSEIDERREMVQELASRD